MICLNNSNKSKILLGCVTVKVFNYFQLKYDYMRSKPFLRLGLPASVTDGKWLDDSLYQKLLILVQICWKYLRISQGSGYLS